MKKILIDIETDGYKTTHYNMQFRQLSGEFHELVEKSISDIFGRKVTISDCRLGEQVYSDNQHGELYRSYLKKRKGEQFVRVTWEVHREENAYLTLDPSIWKWLDENNLTPGINFQVNNHAGLNRDGIVYTDLFKFIPPHLRLAHDVGII